MRVNPVLGLVGCGLVGTILLEPKGLHTLEGSKTRATPIENISNGVALVLISPANSAFWGKEANSGSYQWMWGLAG